MTAVSADRRQARSRATPPSIVVRHAWLQKHPSPTARTGEFHWHPPEGDRELRAACVERMRGVDPPAVLWELAPGRVVWTQLFAATAPVDGRRYVGLVLTVIERAGASPAELLDAATLPAAVPWQDGPLDVSPGDTAVASRDVAGTRTSRTLALDRDRRAAHVAARGGALEDAQTFDVANTGQPGDPATLATSTTRELGDPAAFAIPNGRELDVSAIGRALLDGGIARVGDPCSRELARAIASIEQWTPDAVIARVRRGSWLAGQAPLRSDRVAELLAAAWREPRSHSAVAWRVLVELAATRAQSVDDVAARVVAAEHTPVELSAEESAQLVGRTTLVDILHAWGRGRFDPCPTAGSLLARLADAVVVRVLAHLLADRDPTGAIAEARWYALLPADRRTRLFDEVARRCSSLRPLLATGDHPHA